ncbi:MAG: sulfatase-like hydrolase/transferase [Phycisphaerae bacterium]|nr:sulfatase-like hydrolase/transferase [Phycisphaerae bacterium]
MSEDRPNILLIVLDCARSDRWLGQARSSRTPVMDRLAAEGVTLPTTITEKSCTTPAFASLLTGAFSVNHGVWGLGGYRMLDDLPTLPEVLREHGYHTYAEATGPIVPQTGVDRGFEQYRYRTAFDFMHTRWGDLFLERLRTGQYAEPWFLMVHLWELHTPRQVLPEFDSPKWGANTYDRSVSSLDSQLDRIMGSVSDNTLTMITGDHGEKTLDEVYREGTAVDYIRKLYHIDGHRGMKPGTASRLIGPVALQQLRSHLQPALERFSQRETPRDFTYTRWTHLRDFLCVFKLAPWLRLEDLFILRSPVRLTRMLEKRGVLDEERNRKRVARLVDTVGHDRLFDMYLRMWRNQFHVQMDEGHIIHVYDYLVRVPWVIHWPGELAGGLAFGRMARQVDIAPTLLDLLGIHASAGFSPDGQSVGPLLRGEPWGPLPAYLSVAAVPKDAAIHGVRTERHRYVYGPENPALPRELYDLQVDPAEKDNIAQANPGLCEELQSLAEKMIPEGGPRVGRLEGLSESEQREIELRLRELGYVD